MLAAFRDGLSNTLSLAEKKVGSGDGRFDPSRDWIAVSPWPPGAVTADDYDAICSNLRDASTGQRDTGRIWLYAGAANTDFYTLTPPNSMMPDCGTWSGGSRGVLRPAAITAAGSMRRWRTARCVGLRHPSRLAYGGGARNPKRWGGHNVGMMRSS